MMQHKLSANALMFGLTIGAVICFAAFVLYGAWIDGKRQKIRNKGLHPVTTEHADVEAKEQEDGD